MFLSNYFDIENITGSKAGLLTLSSKHLSGFIAFACILAIGGDFKIGLTIMLPVISLTLLLPLKVAVAFVLAIVSMILANENLFIKSSDRNILH